jgi:hypothetical protein
MNDAGRYRKVFTSLWLQPCFLALTDAEKVLVFYLLTGPQTNRIGCYRLSPNMAAEDLGMPVNGLRNRLRRVTEAMGYLFDAHARVLYIPSWWRWNPPANANVMRGSLKDLKDVPPCSLVITFAQNLETIPETLREAFRQGLAERFPKGTPIQEQYQEQYQEQDQEQHLSPQGAGTAEDDRKTAENGTKTENAENGEIAVFLRRFCELYAQYRHGAKYFVARAKHVPLIRALLAAYGRERLEKLAMVLLNTDDEWVQTTDRGIGILSIKASWLEERLASYEAKHFLPELPRRSGSGATKVEAPETAAAKGPIQAAS